VHKWALDCVGVALHSTTNTHTYTHAHIAALVHIAFICFRLQATAYAMVEFG